MWLGGLWRHPWRLDGGYRVQSARRHQHQGIRLWMAFRNKHRTSSRNSGSHLNTSNAKWFCLSSLAKKFCKFNVPWNWISFSAVQFLMAAYAAVNVCPSKLVGKSMREPNESHRGHQPVETHATSGKPRPQYCTILHNIAGNCKIGKLEHTPLYCNVSKVVKLTTSQIATFVCLSNSRIVSE